MSFATNAARRLIPPQRLIGPQLKNTIKKKTREAAAEVVRGAASDRRLFSTVAMRAVANPKPIFSVIPLGFDTKLPLGGPLGNLMKMLGLTRTGPWNHDVAVDLKRTFMLYKPEGQGKFLKAFATLQENNGYGFKVLVAPDTKVQAKLFVAMRKTVNNWCSWLPAGASWLPVLDLRTRKAPTFKPPVFSG